MEALQLPQSAASPLLLTTVLPGGSMYACTSFPGIIHWLVGPQAVVTLTSLINPANSFGSVGRPQLIPCCERVSLNLTVLVSSQLPSCAVMAYQRWGHRVVLGIFTQSYRRLGPLLLCQ